MRTFVISSVIAASSALAVNLPRAPVNILIGNDDGWATANIRSFYKTLNAAGFSSVISAPAENKSGSSSFDATPTPIGSSGGQFGTIPPNSPATGFDPADPRINYANSYPVSAIKHGLSSVTPKFFGGKPDLVVAGPNVGENLGLIAQFSGTVGAAVEGAKQGIPSIAFSGISGTQHSYINPDPIATVYSEVALKVVQTIVNSGTPYLPPGVILNVNFAAATTTKCTKASDFKFFLSRVIWDLNPFTDDVDHCGTKHLPDETSVVKDHGDACYVSISVMDTKDKLDVDKDIQKVARDKLRSILSCI